MKSRWGKPLVCGAALAFVLLSASACQTGNGSQYYTPLPSYESVVNDNNNAEKNKYSKEEKALVKGYCGEEVLKEDAAKTRDLHVAHAHYDAKKSHKYDSEHWRVTSLHRTNKGRSAYARANDTSDVTEYRDSGRDNLEGIYYSAAEKSANSNSSYDFKFTRNKDKKIYEATYSSSGPYGSEKSDDGVHVSVEFKFSSGKDSLVTGMRDELRYIRGFQRRGRHYNYNNTHVPSASDIKLDIQANGVEVEDLSTREAILDTMLHADKTCDRHLKDTDIFIVQDKEDSYSRGVARRIRNGMDPLRKFMAVLSASSQRTEKEVYSHAKSR